MKPKAKTKMTKTNKVEAKIKDVSYPLEFLFAGDYETNLPFDREDVKIYYNEYVYGLLDILQMLVSLKNIFQVLHLVEQRIICEKNLTKRFSKLEKAHSDFSNTLKSVKKHRIVYDILRFGEDHEFEFLSWAEYTRRLCLLTNDVYFHKLVRKNLKF